MDRQLATEEKRMLLDIARSSITDYLENSTLPEFSVNSPGLLEKRGCFVTIKQKGSLRGCIGSFMSEKPIHLLVQEMAISAATRDPRFYPMKRSDISNFDLEISVLTPMKKISSIEEIIVGTHGLYIEKDHYRGVLLPQVAIEYGWDRETFLNQTCHKAGLSPGEWQDGADIYIFSAEIFS